MKSSLKAFATFTVFFVILIFACKKEAGNTPNFAVINIGKDSLFATQEASFNIVYNSTSALKNLKIEEAFLNNTNTRVVLDSIFSGGYSYDFVVKYKVPDTALAQNVIKLRFTVTRADNSTSTTERSINVKPAKVSLNVSADKTEAAIGEKATYTLSGSSEVEFRQLLISDVDTATGVATILKDSSFLSKQVKSLNYNYQYTIPQNAVPGTTKVLVFTLANFINNKATETRKLRIKM